MNTSITIGAVWEGNAAFSNAIKAIDTLQSSLLSFGKKSLSLSVNTDALDSINKKLKNIDDSITQINAKKIVLKKESTDKENATPAASYGKIFTDGLSVVSNSFSVIKGLDELRKSTYATSAAFIASEISLKIATKAKSLYAAASIPLATRLHSLNIKMKLNNAQMAITSLRTNAISLSKRSYAASLSFVTTNLSKLKNALTLTSLKMASINVVTKLLTASQWLFNAALYGNPIGLIVGVVAAGALSIYKFWQPISAFLGGVFDGFMGAIAPLKTALEPIFTLLSPLVNWFGELLTPVSLAGEQLEGFASAGEMVGSVIGNAFTILLLPITAVINAIGYLGKLLPEIGSFLGFGDGDESEQEKSAEKDQQKTNKTIISAEDPVEFPKNKTNTEVALSQLTTLEIKPPVYQELVQNDIRSTPVDTNQTLITKNTMNQENQVYLKANTEPNTSIPTPPTTQQKLAPVVQHISMTVTVNNPTSTVDIEQGISQGLSNQGLKFTDGVV